MKPKQNLIGKQFGKLIVVGEAPYHKNDFAPYWWCKCECGKKTSVRAYHLTKGITKSCGGLVHRTGTSHFHWNGCGDIAGTHFSFLHKQAKRRQISFHLSKSELWDLFLKQNKKCALSGVELTFDSCRKLKDGNASLDRIDSSKGYVKGNVQWVHKTINIMKHISSSADFIKWCQLVVQNNR